MAVFGVEIDEIDEDQPAVGRVSQRLEEQDRRCRRCSCPCARRRCRDGRRCRRSCRSRRSRGRPSRRAAAGCRRAAARRNPCGWRCATKSFALAPTKGRAMTRPMFERIAEPARDPAELVEPLEPERLLVRGDLEHGVGRGVADRLQRAQMLLAEFLDDRRARGVAIAENAGQARLPRSARAVSDSGKAGIGLGKIAPVEIDRRSGDLPMARGRVLAARGLDP